MSSKSCSPARWKNPSGRLRSGRPTCCVRWHPAKLRRPPHLFPPNPFRRRWARLRRRNPNRSPERRSADGFGPDAASTPSKENELPRGGRLSFVGETPYGFARHIAKTLLVGAL